MKYLPLPILRLLLVPIVFVFLHYLRKDAQLKVHMMSPLMYNGKNIVMCLLSKISIWTTSWTPSVIPSQCPAYDQVSNRTTLGEDFDPFRLEGKWFVIATIEPSEPKWCRCTELLLRFTNTDTLDYSMEYQSTCTAPIKPKMSWKIQMPFEGNFSEASESPGLFSEGIPEYCIPKADVLTVLVEGKPNSPYEIWVRYICKDDYLCQIRYSALNIYSRTRQLEPEKLISLIASIHDLGISFNETDFSYPNRGCE